MRIFVAGASGVLGVRIVPRLAAERHEVAAMTRTPAKADLLASLGARPIVCDVYDVARLRQAFADTRPEIVIDELTDLDDDQKKIDGAANARIRTEGTRNVLAVAGNARVITQSVAWTLSGEGAAAVAEHERLVLEAGGVVIRYGQLYGPGTYHPTAPQTGTRIHIDEAARRTLEALGLPPRSVLTLVE